MAELSSSPAKRTKTGAIQTFIDDVNDSYFSLHRAYEEQFWGTKMGLSSGAFSTSLLSSTKEKMEEFLRSPKLKVETEAFLVSGEATAEQEKILRCFARTFSCYQMEDAEAVKLRAECTKIEDDLNASRNTLQLGYTNPADGVFIEKSSVGLRTTLRTSEDEAIRKAAWNGLRSIGPWALANGFCDMVRLRNAMARKLGYEDFYDLKVTQAEGFGKKKLFEILDTLVDGSAELLTHARDKLAKEKGASALEGWNQGFAMSGDVEKKLDPYFPFEKSVERWGSCFSKLGISYEGASMTLDLFDRKGKYSNGFCHWPTPAYVKSDGSWQPSETNFTSLADPSAVGSGKTSLTTLMHEAGHAAHFANIKQGSPLFSQERAPTSVAYAENQSMFLDSLCGDAAWRAKYAKDRSGNPVPWKLHEEELHAVHPFRVFALRSMLSVPYFEKALYELPDDQVTPTIIIELADRVEQEMQGGLAPRPLLSVPHILSDEASCYYHGYVLAEMSVYQTRHFFFNSLGHIVDNPQVGQALTKQYWRCGNSEAFLNLVEGLTGKPLTGEAWLADLKVPVEDIVQAERAAYTSAVEADKEADDKAVDLNMEMFIKDGDKVIADTKELGGFIPACKAFEDYVIQRYFK